jgi:hypothetical protein
MMDGNHCIVCSLQFCQYWMNSSLFEVRKTHDGDSDPCFLWYFWLDHHVHKSRFNKKKKQGDSASFLRNLANSLPAIASTHQTRNVSWRCWSSCPFYSFIIEFCILISWCIPTEVYLHRLSNKFLPPMPSFHIVIQSAI